MYQTLNTHQDEEQIALVRLEALVQLIDLHAREGAEVAGAAEAADEVWDCRVHTKLWWGGSMFGFRKLQSFYSGGGGGGRDGWGGVYWASCMRVVV